MKPADNLVVPDKLAQRLRLIGHLVLIWAIVSWPVGYFVNRLIVPPDSWRVWNTFQPPAHIYWLSLLPALTSIAAGTAVIIGASIKKRPWIIGKGYWQLHRG